MTTARIIFVDDEPRVLDGLRRSLRVRRDEWGMDFVTSGADALELMAESSCDVIVSDIRMPEMDGAELLTHVSEHHPEVARVALSGQAESDAAIKVAIAGHRFLTKPTDAESVSRVVEQLIVRTSNEHCVEVRRMAGSVRALPTIPEHLGQLTALFRASEIDLATAIRAASHDIGLTAKLLQLSTSAFFGARARTASVESVVNALGLPVVQALTAGEQMLWSPLDLDSADEVHLGMTWRHAVATAHLVESIASPANRAFAYAAALLQDVGRFVCLAHAVKGDTAAMDITASGFRGIPYRHIGVELLHLWGLPEPIINAVAERDLEHEPSSSGMGVATALRAAHLLIQQTESRDHSDGAHDEELAALLTHPQLVARGVDWRSAADEMSTSAEQWSFLETPS
jgi:HD-like signal output (HDOD) protein